MGKQQEKDEERPERDRDHLLKPGRDHTAGEGIVAGHEREERVLLEERHRSVRHTESDEEPPDGIRRATKPPTVAKTIASTPSNPRNPMTSRTGASRLRKTMAKLAFESATVKSHCAHAM